MCSDDNAKDSLIIPNCVYCDNSAAVSSLHGHPTECRNEGPSPNACNSDNVTDLNDNPDDITDNPDYDAYNTDNDTDTVNDTGCMFPDIARFRQEHMSNFIMCHININSFRHKYSYLHEILRRKHVDYFTISETKIDSSFPNAQFQIEGYSIFRQDKSSTSGGLLTYIRSDLPHRRLPLCENNSEGVESLCLEVTIGKSKTVICTIYKNPKVSNATFQNILCKIIDNVLQVSSDFVLIGDMNCCPNKSTLISDVCDVYNLKNLIKDPTCHKGNVSTLLDVILVSNYRRYAGVLNCACELSDCHNFVGAATKRFAPSQKPRRIYYRSFKHFNDDAFLQNITSAPFHVGDVFDDIEDVAWFNSKILADIVDEHAPIKTKIIKCDSVPYMNSALRKAQYARNMARNKYKRFGNKFWEENRRHRNNVVAIRKKSLRNYFSDKCAKQDRSFWSAISPFMTDKKNKNMKDIILRENDEIISDSTKVCEVFNDFFCNVAEKIGFEDKITSASTSIEKHKLHPSILKIKGKFGEVPKPFTFHQVPTEVVQKKLKCINIRKATGYDNIPGKLLRLAHSELAMPLANLINKCIVLNNFPVNMKCAEVSPIYKKEDNLIKGNYRPVSVLTTVSKIYESVVNDQMIEFFITIFDDFLGAFRKGYSCQSLLIKLIDDWKKSLDNNEKVGAIFMDLSKAFDCLPHGLLVAKLDAYGFSPSACELIASYLSNRRQRVKISNSRSNWADLNKGVPQGSILGPLLFNIFVNDLFLFIEKCTLYNYADDDTMSKSSLHLSEVLECLKHDCNIALEWFRKNGMQANPEKFQFMILSRDNTEALRLHLDDNTTIESTEHVKVLGVSIDRTLSFTQHVRDMCTRAARQLNALARISRYLDMDSRFVIFKSFIMSNFTYCPLAWHFCGKQNNDKMEKVQERALRILYRDYVSSYHELIERAETTTVFLARVKTLVLEVFKCTQALNPPCLNSLFEIKDTCYSFRNSVKLIQPKRRSTKYGLRSISYLGSKVWNDIANDSYDINDDMTIADFKRFLKNWNGPELDIFTNYL